MSNLATVAKQIEGMCRDLEIDNALAAYEEAVAFQDTIKRLTDAQLKTILSGAYDKQARFWLEGRLNHATNEARKAYLRACGSEEEAEEVTQTNPYLETKRGDWVGD